MQTEIMCCWKRRRRDENIEKDASFGIRTTTVEFTSLHICTVVGMNGPRLGSCWVVGLNVSLVNGVSYPGKVEYSSFFCSEFFKGAIYT